MGSPSSWKLLPGRRDSVIPCGLPRGSPEPDTKQDLSHCLLLTPEAPSLLSIKWEAWSWRPPSPVPDPEVNICQAHHKTGSWPPLSPPFYPCRDGTAAHLPFSFLASQRLRWSLAALQDTAASAGSSLLPPFPANCDGFKLCPTSSCSDLPTALSEKKLTKI